MALATKMAEVAELYELDIIHAHYALPHAVSAYLATKMMGPNAPRVVTTLHGTDITIVGNDPSYRTITRFAIQESDGVTTVSNYLKEETQRELGIERDIEVIPNFVDLNRFRTKPCPDAQALRQGDEKMVIHVSNFRPVKRIKDVVEAFAIAQRKQNLRLLMVGDGPERSTALARVEELGLTDKVNFLGSQDAVEKLLPCADVFVLPSEFESFGLAALEAMACGVPVVASRAGGLAEVVDEHVTGELFEVGQVEELAAKMLKILGDDVAAKAMGQAARLRAETEFSLEKICPLYEAFYERVLS